MSDHFLIFFKGGGGRLGGPSHFRFENLWLEEEDFKDLLEFWWTRFEFKGSGNFILMMKIKALKSLLKGWNREDFGR